MQYLDAAGNAWIQFGDVLIDVRGRPRPVDAPRTPGSGNLFSVGRDQVVMALLAWPHRWEAPQRDVAAAAGVSLGQAHNTLTLLAQAEYATTGREAAEPAFWTCGPRHFPPGWLGG